MHVSTLPSFEPGYLPNSRDSPVSESQAIILGSPPDFLDLDMPMSEALTDLGRSTAEMGVFPPFAWLPAVENMVKYENLPDVSLLRPTE